MKLPFVREDSDESPKNGLFFSFFPFVGRLPELPDATDPRRMAAIELSPEPYNFMALIMMTAVALWAVSIVTRFSKFVVLRAAQRARAVRHFSGLGETMTVFEYATLSQYLAIYNNKDDRASRLCPPLNLPFRIVEATLCVVSRGRSLVMACELDTNVAGSVQLLANIDVDEITRIAASLKNNITPVIPLVSEGDSFEGAGAPNDPRDTISEVEMRPLAPLRPARLIRPIRDTSDYQSVDGANENEQEEAVGRERCDDDGDGPRVGSGEGLRGGEGGQCGYSTPSFAGPGNSRNEVKPDVGIENESGTKKSFLGASEVINFNIPADYEGRAIRFKFESQIPEVPVSGPQETVGTSGLETQRSAPEATAVRSVCVVVRPLHRRSGGQALEAPTRASAGDGVGLRPSLLGLALPFRGERS